MSILPHTILRSCMTTLRHLYSALNIKTPAPLSTICDRSWGRPTAAAAPSDLSGKRLAHILLAPLVILGCWLLSTQQAEAIETDESRVQFLYFGHLEYRFENETTANHSFFSLGEQDFFVVAEIAPQLSFLSETVIKPAAQAATGFAPSIERAQLRYDYIDNHSIIVGKFHTPLNYWNDVYHHGRLFFPTIGRPLGFSSIIPIHTLGLNLHGQNLGRLRFGYDLVMGNGISSSDTGKEGTSMSVLTSAHFNPIEGSRLQISYYRDTVNNNLHGKHVGHTGNSTYQNDINLHLFNISLAYFGKRLEFLNEASYLRTYSDSTGFETAQSFTNYVYIGYRLTEISTSYAILDLLEISEKDLTTKRGAPRKIGVGYRREFSPYANIKAQLVQISPIETTQKKSRSFELQLSYGF
jgi:hypothetical protein